MDIVNKLKKELLKQAFTEEQKQTERLNECKHIASIYAQTENAIAVLSDMKANISYIYYGGVAEKLGLAERNTAKTIQSIWEEEIFSRIHPDDLQEKHLQELRFFHFLKSVPGKETPGLLPYTQYAHARSFGQVCTHLAQNVLYSEPLKRKCMVILMPLQLFNGYVVKLHHS